MSIVGIFNVGNPDGIPLLPLIKHSGNKAGSALGSGLSISPCTNSQYSTESQSKCSARVDSLPSIYLSAEASKEYQLILLRKMGVPMTVLVRGEDEILLEDNAEIIACANLGEFEEALKDQLIA